MLYVWDSTSPAAATTVVLPGAHKAIWEELMTDSMPRAMGPASFHYM